MVSRLGLWSLALSQRRWKILEVEPKGRKLGSCGCLLKEIESLILSSWSPGNCEVSGFLGYFASSILCCLTTASETTDQWSWALISKGVSSSENFNFWSGLSLYVLKINKEKISPTVVHWFPNCSNYNCGASPSFAMKISVYLTVFSPLLHLRIYNNSHYVILNTY